jgi:hypothetical protein
VRSLYEGGTGRKPRGESIFRGGKNGGGKVIPCFAEFFPETNIYLIFK